MTRRVLPAIAPAVYLGRIAPFACTVPFALTVTGCGPMYDTQYSFTPPASESGRACLFQCENGKLQCHQLEDMRVSQCEQQSRYEAERCADRMQWTKGRDPKWYECGGSSCSADYTRCEEMYRSCYQTCGGTVDAVTRCVANCDQVPPQGK